MISATALSYLLAGFIGALLLTFFVLAGARSLALLTRGGTPAVSPATPTAGGVAFVIPLLTYLVLLAGHGPAGALGLASAGALLAVVALWHDVRGLPARALVAARWLVVAGYFWLSGLGLSWFVTLIAVLALWWYVTLLGPLSDQGGIVGVQCLVFCVGAQLLAFGVAGWVGDVLWLASGAVLGSLVYIWPPSRVRMGQVGGSFVGLLLGVLTLELWQSGTVPLVASLILLAGLWFDGAYTLCVRMASGRLGSAAGSGLYGKLAEKMGQQWTTIAFLLFGSCWLVPLAWLTFRYPSLGALWLAVAVLPLAGLSWRLRVGLPNGNEE